MYQLKHHGDPVSVCSARLQGLDLWDGSHHLNLERRRLYDDLEAQLGMAGLSIGQSSLQRSFPIKDVCHGICFFVWLF